MTVFDVDLEIEGKPFTIQVQAGSEEEAVKFASAQSESPEGLQAIMGLAGESKPQEEGFLNTVWESLKVPEKVYRDVIGNVTEKMEKAQNAVAEKTGLPIGTEPTGNLARDVAANLPKITGEVYKDIAPSFISRGSIVTAGALKGGQALTPALRATGKAVAKGAESLSGLEYKTPGVLTEAFENPKLLFGKGLEKAREIYKASGAGKGIRPELLESTSKQDFLTRSFELARKGDLTAEEALEARKTLDSVKKTLPDVVYKEGRKSFDVLAKSKFKDADKAFQKAYKSDALRTVFPTNKSGGSSVIKSSVMAGSLPFLGPAAPIPFSPVVQGSIASLLGAISKPVSALSKTPVTSGPALGALLSRLGIGQSGD